MKFEKHTLSLAADVLAEYLTRKVNQVAQIDQKKRQKKNVRLMTRMQNVNLVHATLQHYENRVDSESGRSQLCTDQLSMVASGSEV